MSSPFLWNSKKLEQKVFKSLKIAFITSLVLENFKSNLETGVKSDASDYIVAAVLSQKHHDVMLRLGVFMSNNVPRKI